MRLLSIEDDFGVQQVIEDSLCSEFEVIQAATLQQARDFLATQSFDIILLDLQLPDGNGLDFCRTLRKEKKTSVIPIVILSGRSTVNDRVNGLEMGALDYIAKPFEPDELLARVKVSSMRGSLARISSDNNLVQVGRLFIDARLQRVLVDDEGVERDLLLTPIEFKTLTALLRAKGKTLSRPALIDAVWGSSNHIAGRTVDKNVCALRKKLTPFCDAIVTQHDQGYLFVETPAPEPEGRLAKGLAPG